MEQYEIYMPRGNFITQAGFSEDDFRIFCKVHEIKTDDSGKYPMFAIMARLNILRKKGKWGTSDADTQLKMVRIQEIKLRTAIKSHEYMPIVTAKSRIRSILLATANKIRYAIKSTSPRLVMISNAHDAESILTDGYNFAIESLLTEANEIKSWEQYGNFAGGNQLAEDSEQNQSVGISEESPPSGEEQCI